MASQTEFRVALATDWQHSELAADDRLLLTPLLEAGIEAEARVWDDPRTDWSSFDAVVIRSCWDYHLRIAEFLAWMERLQELKVQVWNPAEVVVWNHDKRYLRELAASDIDVVPTLWIDKGESPDWVELLDASGWDEIVVKPTVSASAHLTHHLPHAGTEAAHALMTRLAKSHSLMIQPYLEEIVTRGEWSFVFIGGEYSHAVMKRPAAGDFRVQHEFGGRYEIREPTPVQIERAAHIVGAVGQPLLYARVDLVDRVDEADGLRLVELELIEPVLFFTQQPKSAHRFAAALRQFLERGGGQN